MKGCSPPALEGSSCTVRVMVCDDIDLGMPLISTSAKPCVLRFALIPASLIAEVDI
jgi:hypothetical protein